MVGHCTALARGAQGGRCCSARRGDTRQLQQAPLLAARCARCLAQVAKGAPPRQLADHGAPPHIAPEGLVRGDNVIAVGLGLQPAAGSRKRNLLAVLVGAGDEGDGAAAQALVPSNRVGGDGGVSAAHVGGCSGRAGRGVRAVQQHVQCRNHGCRHAYMRTTGYISPQMAAAAQGMGMSRPGRVSPHSCRLPPLTRVDIVQRRSDGEWTAADDVIGMLIASTGSGSEMRQARTAGLGGQARPFRHCQPQPAGM